MVSPYLPVIYRAADQFGVPRTLAANTVQEESGYNPNAISAAGAIGLTQLTPGTAKDLGVNPYDPVQNIYGGVKYLAQQLHRFKSPTLALAAYNAGPGRAEAYAARGTPLPNETVKYVNDILGHPNKGTPMPQQPVLQAAAAGNPGALYGGQSPANKYDIGKHLQNAAAWLETIYSPSGGAALLKAVNDPLNSTHYGLNPIWAQDASGNYVPLQLNTAGGVAPVKVPGGLTPVMPQTTMDLGNRVFSRDKYGNNPQVFYKAGPIGTDERPVQSANGQVNYEAVPGSQTAGKITPREKQQMGTERLNDNLSDLTRYYTKLHDIGATSEPANTLSGYLHNAEAYVGNSELGQFFGRMFNTPPQSSRNTVNTLRSALLNNIRQATGMSSRAMDSDVELQFYLQQATVPTNDYLSNLAAIYALDKTYGKGDVLKKNLPSDIYKQVEERSNSLLQEHPLPVKGGAKPPTPSNGGGITIRRIE